MARSVRSSGVDDALRCPSCGKRMMLIRRTAHQTFGPSYVAQTFVCTACCHEFVQTADLAGKPETTATLGPPCPKCGARTMLACNEPENREQDRRTFACPDCNRSESRGRRPLRVGPINWRRLGFGGGHGARFGSRS
jgi:DNA-directed RNA polymerase subunit RPC12/RpoP